MELFAIATGAETDWVAASDESEARAVYKNHYGLSDRDMEGVEVSQVDPRTVSVYPDGWDYENDEAEPPTAAEIMATMRGPDLVASTNC